MDTVYNVSVRCLTIASSATVVEVTATFQRGSLVICSTVICSTDAHAQCTYRWLDIARDTVVSNRPELDVCEAVSYTHLTLPTNREV